VNFLNYLDFFITGAITTLWTSALSFVLALSLGVVIAVFRRSKLRVLRIIGSVYVEALWNTPVLVQIFLFYFGLASVGVRLPAVVAGILALGINGGAYLSEIIRAGLQSVPRSQLEAARTLGLGRLDIFVHVVLPQAIRTVYPPIVNRFIDLVLASSLLSAIAVDELTSAARRVNSATYETLAVFGFALVFYLVLTNLISFVASIVGRYAFKPSISTSVRLRFRGSRLETKDVRS
jgi:polar amino acid transport system permease protein